MKAKVSERDKKSQQQQKQQNNASAVQSSFANKGDAVQMKKNPFLPADVQSKMENSLGADFSDVKIHKNSEKASDLGAHAFAQGNEVHFAQGKFDPGSKQGQSLIGHELAHVVQQRNGEVKADVQMKGIGINTDNSLEADADKKGELAAEGKPAAAQTKSAGGSKSVSNSNNAPVQGFFGSLVKSGLNFLKNKVVEMIPQEYKDMIPQPLKDMASQIADKGIEMAGGLADQHGGALVNKAKTKLASVMPPQLVALADKIPPEVRTYLEGLLEKGGQIAKGALEEGKLPTGDQMKAFGKEAGTGAVDLGKQMIPKVIPPEVKEMVDKLPPEVKDFATEQFEKGTDALKDGINKGEMPDGKAFLEQAAESGKDKATDFALRKGQELLNAIPAKAKDAITKLPEETKTPIVEVIAEAKGVDVPSVPEPEPAPGPTPKPGPTGGGGGEEKKILPKPKPKRNRAAEAEAAHVKRIRGAAKKK